MADTRDALLRAASTLLAKEGPAALTVRRIAAEAGVSTMGVYSRFGGKDGVVDALLREGFDDLSAAMDAVRPDRRSAGRPAAAAARPTASSGSATRPATGSCSRAPCPASSPSAESIDVGRRRRSTRARRAACGRCIDAGLLAGGDPRQEIACSLWAASHGLISLELCGRKPEAVLAGDDPYDRTMAAMIRGLSP